MLYERHVDGRAGEEARAQQGNELKGRSLLRQRASLLERQDEIVRPDHVGRRIGSGPPDQLVRGQAGIQDLPRRVDARDG